MKKQSSIPPLIVHVDVDSPLKLLTFHRIKNIDFSEKSLEEFYETSWERALIFFDKLNIKATFFVVGDELENSKTIQNVILKAHNAGHEIENHTYSHPFGLANLPIEDIRHQIIKANNIIYDLTGRHPIGFRSPGYSINSQVLKVLKECNIKYDSSVFWSIMNPILKYGQKYIFKNGIENEGFGEVTRKTPTRPYYPSSGNWNNPSDKNQSVLELPLPRTNNFGIPFYNNFNLLIPQFYSKFLANRINRSHLVYLFHIIEFMDVTDNVPKELIVHPNLKRPLKEKLKLSEDIISNLYKRYELKQTADFVNNILHTTTNKRH